MRQYKDSEGNEWRVEGNENQLKFFKLRENTYIFDGVLNFPRAKTKIGRHKEYLDRQYELSQEKGERK